MPFLSKVKLGVFGINQSFRKNFVKNTNFRQREIRHFLQKLNYTFW